MTERPGAGSGGQGGETRPVGLTYDTDADERPSQAVVRAVATLTNTPVLDLEPLFDAVDPDCLDGLAADDRATDGRADESRAGPTVTFPYAGCTVTVKPGEVRVRKRDGDP